MLEAHEPRAGVVRLPRPGVPADRGLASLGLVMQLAGRTSGALAGLVASVVLIEARFHHHAGWLFSALVLSLTRSYLHRRAGRDLVYGRRSIDGAVADPFQAMRAYIVFGLGHAGAVGLGGTLNLGGTPATAVGAMIALALWPLALLVVMHRRRGAAIAEVPLGEDRGLEGASIVMTVLGACGVVSTGAIVLLLGALPSRHLQHGWGAMLVVVFVLLLARSCLHLRAGLAGMSEISFDRPAELASRYVNFGVISAFCVAAVLLLLAMSERLTPEAIVSVAAICWLLVAWPAIIKRYFHHRQFAELLAGDRVIHRRAPDAGLTGLGWLLAGHATLVASLLTVAATAAPRGPGRALVNLVTLTGPVGHSPGQLAVGAGLVALELCAAVALLRMSDHRRAIATLYALAAAGVAVALAWPLTRALGRHPFDLRMGIRLIPVAVQMVLPAATLLLVHRAIAPTARARYRPAGASAAIASPAAAATDRGPTSAPR